VRGHGSRKRKGFEGEEGQDGEAGKKKKDKEKSEMKKGVFHGSTKILRGGN
jgi:hypothetical protein